MVFFFLRQSYLYESVVKSNCFLSFQWHIREVGKVSAALEGKVFCGVSFSKLLYVFYLNS